MQARAVLVSAQPRYRAARWRTYIRPAAWARSADTRSEDTHLRRHIRVCRGRPPRPVASALRPTVESTLLEGDETGGFVPELFLAQFIIGFRR
jgi:hypothetical protein